MKNLDEKLRTIKIIAMDFDGVLTDNKVITNEDGKEMVICDRSDSLGIDMLRKEKQEIDIVVISKETSKVVKARCKKLNIKCINGKNNKIEELKKIVEKNGLKLENAAFIGNDVNDIECIKSSGIGVAVSNSSDQVLQVADIVTKKRGGHGAVREFIEIFLKFNR